LNGKPNTNTVPNDIWFCTFVGPAIRKVACMSNVFTSSLGDGARVIVVVGVVVADSIAAGGDGGCVGDAAGSASELPED